MDVSKRIRRDDFLKTTGAVAAGVAAGVTLPHVASAASARTSADAITIWTSSGPSNHDWSKDPILRAIEAATNTRITIAIVSSTNYTDRITAAIASNSLPDIIGDVGGPEPSTLSSRWVRDGVLAPFEGRVAAAAPNVLAEYRANPSLNELKIDGKIYRQPVGWGSGNFPNMGIIHLRKDLLDTYGMAPPDTFDQYFAFVKTAMKHGQAGVLFNGASGVGPALNPFVGAYGVPYLGWTKVNGGYGYWAVQPGTKEALLLFRKMVAMGLVDPSAWSLGTTTLAQDRYTAGKCCTLIFNGGGFIGRFQNALDVSRKGYKEYLLPAPTAGAGHRGYTKEPQFWGWSYLGNMAHNNPVAAARVMNYLISPAGYRLTALGIAGRDYKTVGGRVVYLPARAKDGFVDSTGATVNTVPHPLAFEIVSWEPQSLQDIPILYGKDAAFRVFYRQGWDNQGKYQIPTYGLSVTTPRWTKFQASGDDLITRTVLQIVKASSEKQAAALFDQMVQQWNALGGAQATSEMSAALAAIYK